MYCMTSACSVPLLQSAEFSLGFKDPDTKKSNARLFFIGVQHENKELTAQCFHVHGHCILQLSH